MAAGSAGCIRVAGVGGGPGVMHSIESVDIVIILISNAASAVLLMLVDIRRYLRLLKLIIYNG